MKSAIENCCKVRLRTRTLWKSFREIFLDNIPIIFKGFKFESFVYISTYHLSLYLPSPLWSFLERPFIFILFHFYLFYVLVISITNSVFKRFKMKGSRVIPNVSSINERAGLLLTFVVIAQSIFQYTLGLTFVDKLIGWAFQIRPQINIKPQIKISSKKEENEENVSLKNAIDTSLDVGFESDDEGTREMLKKFNRASDALTFASDLSDAIDGIESKKPKKLRKRVKKEKITEKEHMSISNGAENLDESFSMVKEWLNGTKTTDAETINKHLLKLVASNIAKTKTTNNEYITEDVDV